MHLHCVQCLSCPCDLLPVLHIGTNSTVLRAISALAMLGMATRHPLSMLKEGLSAPAAVAAHSLDVVKLALEAHSGSSTDDVVAILPKHTKVLVTGNNRTKRALVGQEAVVKKAVGLGGWHWLVGETLAKPRNHLG